MENVNIAVLIPCYNEEKTIVKVIRDFKRRLPDAQIYVYDNNSTDMSYQLALGEGCIVRKVFYQGKGHVVRRMFSEIDADCYLMVDADATYFAKDAKKLVKSILNHEADMVIGDRLSGSYFKENKKFFHNFGNKLVCILVNLLFSVRINDVLSGYRAFSREFVKSMPILSNNFEIEAEMTIYAIVNYYSIRSVMISYKDRIRGSVSKIHTIKDGILILYTVISLYKDMKTGPCIQA